MGWAVKYPASLTAFGVRAFVCVESIVLVKIVIPEAEVVAVKALKVLLDEISPPPANPEPAVSETDV